MIIFPHKRKLPIFIFLSKRFEASEPQRVDWNDDFPDPSASDFAHASIRTFCELL
jgi:hypothetical protein